jgi:hypothetical protein
MCGSHKISHKAKAKDLYSSPRFKKCIEYAQLITCEKNIYILSAQYGLLPLDKEIEPYDKSIYGMSEIELQKWADIVISQLKTHSDIVNDTYIFLADESYSNPLIQFINNPVQPLKSIGQEEHLAYLEKEINKLRGIL